MIKMHIGLHVKYPLFLSDFNETPIIAKYFRRNHEYQIFIKIRPVGAQLFHAGRTDGQTDMKKLIVVFRNFVSAPKK